MREPQAPPPRPEPVPQPPVAQREPTYEQSDSRNQRDDRIALNDRIALKSHLTGLQQVVWLLRGDGGDDVMLEVTPGARYDPQNVTILALEPITVQVSGGLYARDFERMAAWINSNRDLIDEVWYDELEDDSSILDRVRKVPPPGWR